MNLQFAPYSIEILCFEIADFENRPISNLVPARGCVWRDEQVGGADDSRRELEQVDQEDFQRAQQVEKAEPQPQQFDQARSRSFQVPAKPRVPRYLPQQLSQT